MIEIYAAYRNQDDTEGRGPMILDRVFIHKQDCIRYLRMQRGIMGRRPADPSGPTKTGWEGMGDWDIRTLHLFESLDDVTLSEEANLKASGLAKLTPEEQRALGL